MAQDNTFQKDANEAKALIDYLHKEYQKYFLGVERHPPLLKRKELENKIHKLQMEMSSAANITNKFLANSVIARFRTMAVQWDKAMRDLENGTSSRGPKTRPK